MKIRIPAILLPWTKGVDTINVEGSTVKECLDALIEKYPEVKYHLFDIDGNLYKYFGLYLNNKHISGQLEFPTQEQDELFILAATVGG
jgi:molybdopterin converting factor small subunit